MTALHRSSAPTVLKLAGPGVAARQVRAIVSTGEIDRCGDIVDQAGIDLTAFRRSPTVLWQHDADRPIAKCLQIGIEGGALVALVEFPAEGISETADEVYGLIRAGVVNSTSIGFRPLKQQPIDQAKPYAGQRYTKVELMEFSFVSVPANAGARITQRSTPGKTLTTAEARRILEAQRRELGR